MNKPYQLDTHNYFRTEIDQIAGTPEYILLHIQRPEAGANLTITLKAGVFTQEDLNQLCQQLRAFDAAAETEPGQGQ